MAQTKQAKKRAALTPEQQREKTLAIVTPIVSVLLALIVGAIVIACLGKNPIEGYGAMVSGALGDARARVPAHLHVARGRVRL